MHQATLGGPIKILDFIKSVNRVIYSTISFKSIEKKTIKQWS